jgi:hypothetical protein
VFRHHALKDSRLPCQLPTQQADEFDLVRHRQPLEIFADIERDVRSLEIAAAASLKAIVLVNRCSHLVNPSHLLNERIGAMSKKSVQLTLGPMEVTTVNKPKLPVKNINPLAWVREAILLSRLSQGYMAAAMGISEPLLSAQLSDHNTDKHLSLRRLSRVDDEGFWCELALSILECFGKRAVVMTEEQYEIHMAMVAALADTARYHTERLTA